MGEEQEGSGRADTSLTRPLGFLLIFSGFFFVFMALVAFPSWAYEYFYGIPAVIPVLSCTLPAIITGTYVFQTDDAKIPLWVYSFCVVSFSLTLFIMMLTTHISINYVYDTTEGHKLLSDGEVLAYSLIPIVPVFEIVLIVMYFVPPASTIDGHGIRYPVSRYERAIGQETRVVPADDVSRYYLLYRKVENPKSDAIDDKYALAGLGFIVDNGETFLYNEFYSEVGLKAQINNMDKNSRHNWNAAAIDIPLKDQEEWEQFETEYRTTTKKRDKTYGLFMVSIFTVLGGIFLSSSMAYSAEGLPEIIYTFIFLLLISITPLIFLVGSISFFRIVMKAWNLTYILVTYLRLEEVTNQNLIPVLDIPKSTKKHLGIDDSTRSPLH